MLWLHPWILVQGCALRRQHDITCAAPSQEFAHPQARFLHEKQRSLSPRTQRWLSWLLATINRASFKAIDGAMFVGTVRPPAQPPDLTTLWCFSLSKEAVDLRGTVLKADLLGV